MRRSVRAPKPAAYRREVTRATSPSVSETTIDASPSTTPSPSPEEIAARHASLPGNREDGTPKRPMNAFILFSNEKRSELADLNPHLSNAAVSVLLGQSWRDMSTAEKASYVAVARKIKEDFVALHPDARSRGGSRKGKRKIDKIEGGPRVAIRNIAPPSLHALALVGSRLNQQGLPRDLEDQPPQIQGLPSSPCHHPASPSLLEQLCTIAENEQQAAAHMLSSLSAF
mmetsp:Transcript_49856/g.99176  ORF Transcript_49856/g.99176 Transcript_49856/m.99176 type:complete len:228 (-) Transcript_49856:807-1490(-)